MYKKLKCYIYGAGNEYNRLCSYLPLYNIDVLGIITTTKNIYSHIDRIPCITVDEIRQDEIDYIIIAVQKWKEIADILKKKE